MAIVNTVLTLQDLPAPPEGKTGWPWTEQSESLPDKMPDGSEWPRVSIVTPSYNQGQFIEETIRSILLQGYPNLEYIIIDGSSSDNSVEIITKYETWLAYWVSESDRGQSHAVNKGLNKVSGEIIGWQNSDDFYQPNAFGYAAKMMFSRENPDFLCGVTRYINENHELLYHSSFPYVDKERVDIFIQNQSTFFKSKVIQENHYLDETFQHTMDYDFFWRVILAEYQFLHTNEVLSSFRQHPQAKGTKQIAIANLEFTRLYKNLYSNTNMSPKAKYNALDKLRSFYLNNYRDIQLKEFRENIVELVKLGGWSAMDFSTMLRYLISFLGTSNIRRLRNIKHGKYHDA
jgi:glycosyltransferase involved in cell wall biosynthesis